MPAKSRQPESSGRLAIITGVKTYLAFFVLIVLVVEALLGAVALRTQGQTQVLTIGGIVFVITLLIGVVTFCAYRKPEALLRSAAGPSHPQSGALEDFCRRISGYWWSRIISPQAPDLGFVEITLNAETRTVQMKGASYNLEGERLATWETRASCIDLSEGKVFYYWTGLHMARPYEPYEGIGELTFPASRDRIDSGISVFSDTNLTDIKGTTKKSADYRRCTDAEVQVMVAGESKRMGELIHSKST